MEIPEVIREKARDFKEKELEEYILRVDKLLEGMKTGDSLVIAKVTKVDTRELFIEIIKWYMDRHREDYQDGLSFADGFNELRKYDLAFIKGSKAQRRNGATVKSKL